MEFEEEEKEEEENMNWILNPNEVYNLNISNITYIPKIKNLFEFIISQNNINKNYKIALIKIRGFNPISIFNEIDTISSGFINSKDLDEYLSKNNINIEKELLQLFIRQFNKEGNGNNLCQKDFIEFFYFDINKTRVKIGELNFNKNEIDKNFLDLIKAEFELIKNIKNLINEIIHIKEFSTFEAFNIISENNNYIDDNNLEKFLEKKFQKNEIKELIYRIDLNNDKKITYEEFQDFFFPFQSHLNLDFEEEKQNFDYFIQNKYFLKLNSYEDIFLSSPNILDKKIQVNEIKLNLKNEKEINNFNEFDKEENKINNEDFKIIYDEKLLNDLNEDQEINNKNNKDKDNFLSTTLDYENDKIKTSEIINELNIVYRDNYNKLNEKDENQDILNINSINNINNENIKQINNNSNNNNLSNSATASLNNNNNININNNNIEKKIKSPNMNNLTEKDKEIVRYFIDYIHSIILLENKSESMKESLSLCNDITLSDIFNIFNKDRDDLISKNNFIKICNMKFYIYPTQNQVQYLYDRYDIDNDGILNKEEFIKMLSPLKEEYLLLNQKRTKNKNIKEISFASKKKVIELLKQLIENESVIYDLKKKLINQKNFNFVFLWGIMLIFSQDLKKLDKEEFNNFLEKFGCYLTKYELDMVFYKISNGNNDIKYDSLYKEIITYN